MTTIEAKRKELKMDYEEILIYIVIILFTLFILVVIINAIITPSHLYKKTVICYDNNNHEIRGLICYREERCTEKLGNWFIRYCGDIEEEIKNE